MLADLDLLLIAVFCTADDLLPEPAKNARRILTDMTDTQRSLYDLFGLDRYAPTR